MQTRWSRSRENKVLFGVCSGIARELQMDVWLLRLIFILSILWFGTGLGLYVILAVIMPHEDKVDSAMQAKFLGVCLRISKRYNFDVVITRLIAVFSILSSFGMFLIAYFLIYFFMPETDAS